MPRGHGHGGGHGGHHGGGHGGRGRGGWGRGGGGWYGYPYPYPATSEIFVEESDLDRELKRLKILEQMKKLSGGKAVSGFDMPSTSTLLIGAAVVGAAYFLMRKR